MRPDDDPGHVVREIFTAIAERRWDAAAAYVHPDAADDFKEAEIETAEQSDRDRSRMRDDPERSERIDTRLREPPWYESTYGVSSLDALRRMPASEMVARFAQSQDPAGVHTRTDPARRPTKPMTAQRDVLGHVLEADDLAHVVVRRTFRSGSRESSFVDVVTLRRTPDGWRVVTLGIFQNYFLVYPPA